MLRGHDVLLRSSSRFERALRLDKSRLLCEISVMSKGRSDVYSFQDEI